MTSSAIMKSRILFIVMQSVVVPLLLLKIAEDSLEALNDIVDL